MPITHHTAKVNGVRLHYARAGDPDADELILFVHGFPEFWYAWRKQLATFGDNPELRICAVAPDLRGYNLSDKPAEVGQYALNHVIEDMRELVAHLGFSRCTYVGHDWGGIVGWAFAATYPDLVQRLVIINAPHPNVFDREIEHNPTQRHASRYTLLFRRARAEETLAADDYSALFEHLNAYLNDEDRAEYRAAWSQKGALTGGLNYYRATPNLSGGKEYTVNVPTLVIWGERVM
jgi:epoxide hydrolase 4